MHALYDKLIVIRGAGDIATGIAVRLHQCGFNILMTDTSLPTMIRCSVALGQCLFDGPVCVEGVTAQKADSPAAAKLILEQGAIPVMVDENLAASRQLNPYVIVDAILAKNNLGFHKELAPITIALGPGFNAGIDCDAVIETNRGHNLGRVIYQGPTHKNTGVPGNIAGYSHERVIRAPRAGKFQPSCKIGDILKQGDLFAMVEGQAIYAPLSGMVRGLLNEGIPVHANLKVGDIDPRGEQADFTTVSDKARAIGGAVLEAMLHLHWKRGSVNQA